MLDGFNALRTDKSMTVILLAHCEVKRADPPDGDSYERYQPKLLGRSSALVQEWSDAVLFANFKVLIKDEIVGKNKDTKIETAPTNERYPAHRGAPGLPGQNRYGLPSRVTHGLARIQRRHARPF